MSDNNDTCMAIPALARIPGGQFRGKWSHNLPYTKTTKLCNACNRSIKNVKLQKLFINMDGHLVHCL